MAFYVGQKVVYVSSRDEDCGDGVIAPDRGDIGTICNLFTGTQGKLNLELIEFPAPESEIFDAGWLAENFRPLVENKTDISVLQQICRDVSAGKILEIVE